MAAFRVHTSTGSRRPTTVGGRIMSSLFLLVFAGMGVAVTVMFALPMVQSMSSWGWKSTECRVLSSQVEELLFTLPPEQAALEVKPYRLAVTYQWERDGRTYTGSDVGGGAQQRTRGSAERLLARYRPGGAVPCYVDPDLSSAASLRRPRLWPLLLLGFPLIFVAFGVAGLVGVWRGGWRRRGKDGVAAPRSQRRNALERPGCLAGFFSIFAIAGGAFLLIFIFPLARKLGSGDWAQVPATIVWSGVGEHSGSDSSTYSVDVLYEYEQGGRRWRSNRYDFMFGSSSGGREPKQAAVDRMPAGARVDAWVNPDDPSRAVLSRALGGFIWFALLPLVFVAVGVGGMVFALRSSRKKRRGVEWLPEPSGGGDDADDADDTDVAASTAFEGGMDTAPSRRRSTVEGSGLPAAPREPVTLQPGKSRVGAFVGLLIFTIIWDGIVGFAGWAIWRNGDLGENGCATAFIAVFALVGVLLLISLPRQFLMIFNPRAEIVLASPPAPGVPVALSWKFHGAASRVQRLTLRLEGREEATYRRGTSTTTDKRVFARHLLLDTTDSSQIAAGETLLALPADTMHSFTAPRNKVVWSLKLHGDVPRYPDIDDEVEIVVYPAALATGA